MDAQLMDALAEILADAILTDLKTEMEEEQAVRVATAESSRGTGSRKDQDQPFAVSSFGQDVAQCGDPGDPIVVRA